MRSSQTYKSVARQTSSPRELEASLLLQAASRLQSVHDDWDDDAAVRAKLNDALLYNRKLWSVFLAEMTDANNPMPRDLSAERRQYRHFRDGPHRLSDAGSAPRAAWLADQHQPRACRGPARPRLSL
jgi:hypothetical protein